MAKSKVGLGRGVVDPSRGIGMGLEDHGMTLKFVRLGMEVCDGSVGEGPPRLDTSRDLSMSDPSAQEIDPHPSHSRRRRGGYDSGPRPRSRDGFPIGVGNDGRWG